ncbi:39S ribosomal protein L22, mitochondrial [Eurytemora carolleeae]|uniref:39S ribosomal protein L22, mitochondrial n=1 Tax=Eurytemora carolleeae TaxID=1294199 RepID=UPI000C7598CE|nr:39S ribosomal protein L22, mitochondrial [Eurytemora carolleeae]|eukprot:XP_023346698.1 39S ribosomal protein L22, mitochondrial-like [Eurytemora affinis]
MVLGCLLRRCVLNNINPSSITNYLPVRGLKTSLILGEEYGRGFGAWDQKHKVPGGTKELSWPAYNERVHPPTGEYRPAYICHVRDNIKYSAKKMWPISNFVKGLSVDEAIKQLSFIKLKGAVIAKEVIEEAVELAVKEHNVEFRSNLWVAESFAGKGLVVKGYRRHARGRFGQIEYKYMHYFVKLEEGPPPKEFYDKEKFNPGEMLERWISEQRAKTVPIS